MMFRKFNIFDYAQKTKRPIILDGAMGTMIQERYPELYDEIGWMNKAIQLHPEFITECHSKYIKAGASIVTAYTFRTNPSTYLQDKDGLKISQGLTKQAVQCAIEARKQCQAETTVLIAGSSAPNQSCYDKILNFTREQIYENHRQHIQFLQESGVDLILAETIGHMCEIEIISEICTDMKIPYIMSLYCDENLNLLSGEPLERGVETAQKYHPLAISFNCVFLKEMQQIIERIDLQNLKFPWGCYINCGSEDFKKAYKGQEYHEDFTEQQFVNAVEQELIEFAKNLSQKDIIPSFIGTCCCSTECDTHNLKKLYS